MATLGTEVATLADVAKNVAPNGKQHKIAEVLHQQNPILDDIHWEMANERTGHVDGIRTGLPAAYWRKVNAGVQPSEGSEAEIREGMAELVSWSQVDEKVAKRHPDLAGYRASRLKARLEGMNQTFATSLFYGSLDTNPEQYNGFAERFSSLSAANGGNIIDANGTDAADQASIWLVGWGPETVFNIYPVNSVAGLVYEDKGIETVENAGGVTGALMTAYREKVTWECGLFVKDWRSVVRIANIDVSNLVAESSAAELFKFMISATHVARGPAARWAFYMSPTLFQMLDIQARGDVVSGGGLTYENVDGKRIAMFRGIPVRSCDALLDSEDQVT